LLNVLFNPFTFQKRFQYFTVKQSETLINSPVLVVFISHKEATRTAPHDSLVNLMNNRSEKYGSITATADFSTIANVMHLSAQWHGKQTATFTFKNPLGINALWGGALPREVRM
jgi:hypothetical protein